MTVDEGMAVAMIGVIAVAIVVTAVFLRGMAREILREWRLRRRG